MERKIKTIIHISDVHIRKMLRHAEYIEVFVELYKRLKQSITEENKHEFLIVITGDIVHQKIDICNEQIMLVKDFFINLMSIADLIVIPGNHDMLVNNKDRMDSLTPIIDGINFDNITYLKESKCYKFHNIIFANYSVFDDNRRPNIEETKQSLGDKVSDYTFVGLYHAPLQGCKTELGFSGFDNSDNVEIFDGLDFVMCGDIHLYQTVDYKIPVVYAGSLIQQSFGENLSKHGFLVWNVSNRKHKHIEIQNKNTFVKVEINSIENLELEQYKIVNE